MANKHNTKKCSTGPNQPHSREVEHPQLIQRILSKYRSILFHLNLLKDILLRFLYNPLLIHLTLLHPKFQTKILLQTKNFKVSLLKNRCTLFLKLKLINSVVILEHISSLLVKFDLDKYSLRFDRNYVLHN